MNRVSEYIRKDLDSHVSVEEGLLKDREKMCSKLKSVIADKTERHKYARKVAYFHEYLLHAILLYDVYDKVYLVPIDIPHGVDMTKLGFVRSEYLKIVFNSEEEHHNPKNGVPLTNVIVEEGVEVECLCLEDVHIHYGGNLSGSMVMELIREYDYKHYTEGRVILDTYLTAYKFPPTQEERMAIRDHINSLY